jgi:hypothetical protein
MLQRATHLICFDQLQLIKSPAERERDVRLREKL